MKKNILLAVLSCVLLIPGANAESTPNEVIESTAAGLLATLGEQRAELEGDEVKLFALVDKWLRPGFDTRYAAQRVLAKHWRSASADQRDRFIDVFYKALRESYARGLLEFSADRMTVLPFRGDLAEDRAKVRTVMTLDDGKRVPVHYSMRRTADGWKVWDVAIEGISFVKSYRTDFGSEISARGLEAFIERLESEGLKKEGE